MLFVIISANVNNRMELEPFLVSSSPNPSKKIADVNVAGNPDGELGNKTL